MTTLIRRVLGAVALRPATYEEIEADRGSFGQSAAVVLMSALAAGIGARGFGGRADFIPTMTFVAFAAWAAWALLTYYIGARLMPDVNTRSDIFEMMRTMGFASAPGILRIVGVVPMLAAPIFALTAVWMLLAMIVAVRQALDYTSTARAVAVCAFGWVLTLVIVLVLGLFSPPALAAHADVASSPVAVLPTAAKA
jgi:hypothetical protein